MSLPAKHPDLDAIRAQLQRPAHGTNRVFRLVSENPTPAVFPNPHPAAVLPPWSNTLARELVVP
ncbi:MAG TPA: hypothetical protein VF492_08925 [Verrucomicrobiae bacterium]